jgi:hypothetical protein
MGKGLIIMGADFNANTVARIEMPPTNECYPSTNYNVGFWNYETGVWTNSNIGRNCNINYLHVVPGKTYVINNPNNGMYYDIPYYNASKEVVGHAGGPGSSWTTEPVQITVPQDCYYICFNLYTGLNIDSTPPAVEITGIKITGTTDDALVYEEL